MANEQSGCPLRRWRPFYGAFVAIDEAIEASGHPHAAFEDVRVRILKLLRAATDDVVAEQLCAALDDAMVEALQTLQVAPVPHSKLASTDLASAVGNLGKHHESARIRGLAGDVVRGWKTANDVARATAAKKLGKVSADPIPCQGISTVAVAQGKVRRSVVLAIPAVVPPAKLQVPPAKILPAAATTAAATGEHKKKLYVSPPKMSTTAAVVSSRQNTSETKKPAVAQCNKLEAKKPSVAQSKNLEAKKPIVAQSEKIDAKKPVMAQSEKMETKKQPIVAQSEKMETTKRKLHEGYEEAKRLKRQRLIQKINDKDASKMFEQSQRKMHRAPAARCRISSGVKRCLLPSLQLI